MRRGTAKPTTLANIAEFARMRARGVDWATISKAAGLTRWAAYQITKRHPDAWKAAYDAAMQAACAEVRELAGTDRMLPIIGDYVASAERAERWALNSGVPLFPLPAEAITGADGGMHTLGSFFERYYLPICLSDGSPATIHLYRVSVRRWAMLTGDPPLKAITTDVLARFREALLALRKTTRKKLNPITARNYLRHVQILLDKAGPRARRSRDAAGFLAESPWVKPIKCEWPVPRTVPRAHLSACYEAAESMTYPRLLNVTPGDWWRGLLAVAYNLGLRRATLFALEWSMIDWETRVLTVPAAIVKGRRKLVLPLNDVVLNHLRILQSESRAPEVFRWPHSREWFGKQMAKLQTAAGIMAAKQFGLHAIRRTCATVLWKRDRAAAQLMLGHTALAITREHYVDAIEGLSEAAAAMPQPEGFTKSA